MTRQKYLFLVLLIIIAVLIAQVAWIEHKIDVKEREEALNSSWAEGWDLGYEWGAYNIFIEIIERGFYSFNETWVIYSPEGCGAAFMAELENKGCEVVCATSSAQ